jgi:hypothetical protein
MRDKLQKACKLVLSLNPSAQAFIERLAIGDSVRRDSSQRPMARSGSLAVSGVIRLAWVAVLFLLMVAIPATSQAQGQQQINPRGSKPIPEAAIPSILAAFDRYEVVAMPEDHGLKDLDDLIFALIRNPAFPDKVNDVVVECGNSLYQPLLDRYIAGEDVPLKEARKVWRIPPLCSGWGSGFFEQLYPLLRAINQNLPPQKRLRVLTGGLPIDPEKVRSFEDILKLGPRDAHIASIMKTEVLSRYRKALMLFGTFHLLHMTEVRASAVSMYEKDYPNVTFVISELTGSDAEVWAAFANWPSPSLARAKGTWVGALDLGHFLPPATLIDEKDCSVHHEFPKHLQKPMEDLVDAFLYLGPKDLALKEQFPAYIVLDADYMAEARRAESLGPGGGTPTDKEFYQQFVIDAENPLFIMPKPPDPKDVQTAVESCLDRKSRGNAPR